MIPSWITLNAAASRISARFSGGLVTASFRMSLGGSISPGTYSVSAPMHNSVYGVFAILKDRRAKSIGSRVQAFSTTSAGSPVPAPSMAPAGSSALEISRVWVGSQAPAGRPAPAGSKVPYRPKAQAFLS